MKQEMKTRAISRQTEREPASLEELMGRKYSVELKEDEDGSWVAEIPDLPGCVSFGENPTDAIGQLGTVKRLWFQGQMDAGRTIPEPIDVEQFSGKFVLRIPRVLHKSLDREARKQGLSLNQYILHLLSERHTYSCLEDALEEALRRSLSSTTVANALQPSARVVNLCTGLLEDWETTRFQWEMDAEEPATVLHAIETFPRTPDRIVTTVHTKRFPIPNHRYEDA